ncbi:uncharacterized protein EURHEDRAFT_552413 [Aspergillus ruber CBS 135680]|uniref:Aminotransferase class I/classII large domain-containing protein n=1 Tax=Aspergillus ruber (strain CBS 135680) TaxID=1388766 RepID=A0A017SK38_ASPRC|nr:uncharacterized protein EURHEDRAFT_552413 [Aspergillus ruber CBS 135680]EYE96675.1 hypothetical protein EURHEDRAFT_552413 [Aspergillus ruber CBS 135680]
MENPWSPDNPGGTLSPWLSLQDAAALFLTEGPQYRETIMADNVFITPGTASTLDALAWAVCNDGKGILIPQPLYNGFNINPLD